MIEAADLQDVHILAKLANGCRLRRKTLRAAALGITAIPWR